MLQCHVPDSAGAGHGMRIQVLELTLQCHVLDSAGAGNAHPAACHMHGMQWAAMGTSLPSLGFSIFQPKLSLLQLQPLSRGFFLLEGQSWNKSLPPHDRCPHPICPSPLFLLDLNHGQWQQRTHAVQSAVMGNSVKPLPFWLYLLSSADG